MARNRLSQALDEGAVSLPDVGASAVVGAPAGYDLSALDRERVRITAPFRPDYDAWMAQGYAAGPLIEPADAALVILPRARAAALRALAEAAAAVPPGAPVL